MTGPYIVTTKRHVPEWHRDHMLTLKAHDEILSRVAVATLEDARDRIEKTEGYAGNVYDDLPESGGTITLPDGTVIEVEETTWIRLVMDIRAKASKTAGRDGLDTLGAMDGDTEAQRQILDAFNAQEAPDAA